MATFILTLKTLLSVYDLVFFIYARSQNGITFLLETLSKKGR